jgi:hypothetical protein
MGCCTHCGKRVKGTSSSYLMSQRSSNMTRHENSCKENPKNKGNDQT